LQAKAEVIDFRTRRSFDYGQVALNEDGDPVNRTTAERYERHIISSTMPRLPISLALAVVTFLPAICRPQTPPAKTRRHESSEYAELQRRLARGWNTWDVQSVTTQVLLPQGLAVQVGFLDKRRLTGEGFLSTALIGKLDPKAERVFPGPHAFNGSYTELKLTWKGQSFRLQSATESGDLVLLVTPLATASAAGPLPMTAVFSIGFLWDRPGSVRKLADGIEAKAAGHQTLLFLTRPQTTAFNAPVVVPYLAADLDQPVALSSGRPRTAAQVQAILTKQRAAYERTNQSAGQAASIADSIQTVLAWDTIYDPEHERVISPVSRVWSVDWGGYVLFDWDTFFAASMAAIGDHDLAYADAIETLNEATPSGFVPNYARAGGWKSGDRSEPPVGAITVLALYQKFHERWLLRDSFPQLLAWNRWWAAHRDVKGYLVWGSDSRGQPEDLDDDSRGTLQGARFESGLDNSPMYDDVTFDQKSERMMLADVGLMGMYVADCDALATMATQLGRSPEATELADRAARYRAKLASLWDENTGMFLNKDLINGNLSPRISPTNFYPLLAKAATPQQAERMVHEHLQNPAEFGGDFVLPSIARKDPAFKDQDYWRGRVWGPMNYLVYLGLRNYDQAAAREQLAKKSLNLFLREWTKNGHVHENYNSILGEGDDISSSDRFYHWGALLGFITYLQQTEMGSKISLERVR
jgi:putative isomerase